MPLDWCRGLDEGKRLFLLASVGWRVQFQRVLPPAPVRPPSFSLLPCIAGSGSGPLCVPLGGVTESSWELIIPASPFSIKTCVYLAMLWGAKVTSVHYPGCLVQLPGCLFRWLVGPASRQWSHLVCIQPALGSARRVWRLSPGKSLCHV